MGGGGAGRARCPRRSRPVLAGSGAAAGVDGLRPGGRGARADRLGVVRDRRELRQRLLRRRARHRRRPRRSAASRGLRGRPAEVGQARRAALPRARGARRRRALALQRALVADRRRRGVPARRLVLHRGLAPVRLPRAGRGRGVRLLRAGRGAGHRVRAERARQRPRASAPRWASACSPARCWSPTTCATSARTPSPASGRWRWSSATATPASSTPRSSSSRSA